MTQKRGNYKHGFYGTPTYKSWSEMIYRCKKKGKKYYCDKGIKVCDRWLIFENFLADIGERPKGKTLDRIDNNGDYLPNNCRWATNEEQALNRKSTHYFEHKDKKLTLGQWAKIIGVKRSTLAQRIYVYRWSIERTLQKGGDVL